MTSFRYSSDRIPFAGHLWTEDPQKGSNNFEWFTFYTSSMDRLSITGLLWTEKNLEVFPGQ